jgi:hypothetical protein
MHVKLLGLEWDTYIASDYFLFNNVRTMYFIDIYSVLYNYWIIFHIHLYWYVEVDLRDILVYFLSLRRWII